MQRRKFIEFLGKGALMVPIIPSVLSACGGRKSGVVDTSPFPSSLDELVFGEGLNSELLIKWGDPLNARDMFGFNNDYIAYLPDGVGKGRLWVNHETVNPLFVSGYNQQNARTRKQVQREMYDVGGSLFRIEKTRGRWEVIPDPKNKRITAASEIAIEGADRIGRAKTIMGTLANCSGGITPWGSILTCEENYDFFYGEYDYDTGRHRPSSLGWESFFPDNTPQQYGWVVEFNPDTREIKKHVGLGRMAHECATVQELPDGRVAVYTADDVNGGCIYKYVSQQQGQLYPGTLHVADLANGEWKALSMDIPVLVEKFKDFVTLMIRAREAALMVGGTPMDRPEDIAIDPLSGDVFVALTNNESEGNYHGSLFKITELESYAGTRFSYDTYLTGGEETGFSCPDNLAFDRAGNLWFTNDISGSSIGKGPYKNFGNNGLFLVPRNGEQAGEVFQVASAPNDAELTGPCFTPEGDTLFLAVQHPGSESPNLDNLTSHWPGGGTTVPCPGVVAIQGSLLTELQQQVIS